MPFFLGDKTMPANQANILLVEDDKAMQSFLLTLLHSQNYQCVCFAHGKAALSHLTLQPVDLILLDLGLADMDGLEVLAQLRQWCNLPVIVISARERELDKVKALDSGANDYVTKPFSAAELLARIRVALRQKEPVVTTWSFGDVVLDPVARTVFKNGDALHLTKTEYEILLLLVRHAEKVLTHNQILQQVWGPTYLDRPEYVRVHMAQLRQKVEETPSNPKYLKTEAGVGYRLCF